MSLQRVLTFAAVSLSILGGLHYYVWARLVRDTALPPPWRTVATVTLVLLGLTLPLALFLGRAMGPWKPLSWIAYLWMGLLMLLFLLLLAGDLARLLLAVGGRRVTDPERRLALGRLFGGVVALGAGGLGAFAVRTALKRVRLVEHEVELDRLPRALDGTVIVQLTDVHVGPTIGRELIDDLVARCNALEPDLVVITGDLVDGTVERLRSQVAPLGGLKTKRGVFFVTGNHEYYSGWPEWRVELGRLGIRVLANERVAIGDGADSFDLAGIDDHTGEPDLQRALDGRDPMRELILLAHQPRAIHEAARHGVGLQLSGHTHGGQIWPWNFLVRLQQPYVAGWAKEGATKLYVSRGTGYWGPPMRLGTEAELTKFTLRAPSV